MVLWKAWNELENVISENMGQENVLIERDTAFFIHNSFVIINGVVKNESKEYVELWHCR